MINLSPLWPGDTLMVVEWLRRQSVEHLHYFHPFDFDEDSLRTVLSRARKDLYLGAYLDGHLIWLMLLRGWDEGFPIPMYGICVDQRHLRKGWGRVSLHLAKTLAQERGAEKLRLKVHPENQVARHLYESDGFKVCGVDPKGDLIYEVSLT